MNQELKTLNKLMSPTGGDQSGQIAKNTLLNPNGPKEVKITDAMKKAKPVVNKARSGNKLSGVSDFLGNPAVQMALINFGQAFANAGNYSGQDNPINQIGNAGKQFIISNANNKALKAFEQGKPIAQAAGQFADPNLVANLEQRRQQHEQFNKEYKLEIKKFGLQEDKVKNDATYQTAVLANDKKLASAKIHDMKFMEDANKDLTKARAEYLRAQANKLNNVGSQNTYDAKYRNDYLTALDTQDRTIQDSIDTVVSGLENNLDVTISDKQLQQLENGVITTADIDLSSADASSLPFYSGDNPQKQAQKMLGSLQSLVRQKQENRAQANLIQEAQTQALSGASKSDVNKERQSNLYGGQDNPIPVTGQDEIRQQPAGTYVDYYGTTYKVLGDGKIQEVK